MTELADVQDLGSCAARRVGSTPTTRTSKKRHPTRTNIKQSEPMLFKEELVRIVYNFLYIYRSYGVMLVPSRVMGADLLGAFSGEIYFKD